MRHLITGLLILFASLSCWGRVTGFVVWQPVEGGPRYVLPRVDGKTPEALALEWQEKVKASSDYGSMENAQKLNLPAKRENFSALPAPKDGTPNVSVILNRPNQMTGLSTYLPTVFNAFESGGPRLYGVPVGLETVLSKEDMQQFRKALNNFDGQIGVGGDDPSPQLYGKKSNDGTVGDVCFNRDLMQMAYLQEYLEHGKGRVFHICGSMQRAGLNAGHGFHTDIGHLTKVPQQGPNGTSVMVEVIVDEESQWAMATGKTRFSILSNHHAGLDENLLPGRVPEVWINAYNIEANGTRGQVVSGFEYQGRFQNVGMATQKHPEFGGSREAEDVLRYVIAGFQQGGRHAPESVVRCMDRSLRLLVPQATTGKNTQRALGP